MVCAQSAEHSAYEKLATALHREVELLSNITDASSAKAALPELRRVVEELKALRTQTDSEQLWRYIENTPGIKQPLLDDAERLLVELQRLESAKCYAVQPLYNLLRPMLTPAAA